MAPMDATCVVIALACHFVVPHLVELAMPAKNYLEWQAIWLAIHSTVGVDRL